MTGRAFWIRLLAWLPVLLVAWPAASAQAAKPLPYTVLRPVSGKQLIAAQQRTPWALGSEPGFSPVDVSLKPASGGGGSDHFPLTETSPGVYQGYSGGGVAHWWNNEVGTYDWQIEAHKGGEIYTSPVFVINVVAPPAPSPRTNVAPPERPASGSPQSVAEVIAAVKHLIPAASNHHALPAKDHGTDQRELGRAAAVLVRETHSKSPAARAAAEAELKTSNSSLIAAWQSELVQQFHQAGAKGTSAFEAGIGEIIGELHSEEAAGVISISEMNTKSLETVEAEETTLFGNPGVALALTGQPLTGSAEAG